MGATVFDIRVSVVGNAGSITGNDPDDCHNANGGTGC
jgi:hypothetical protein